jgi:hypothetical protein
MVDPVSMDPHTKESWETQKAKIGSLKRLMQLLLFVVVVVVVAGDDDDAAPENCVGMMVSIILLLVVDPSSFSFQASVHRMLPRLDYAFVRNFVLISNYLCFNFGN